MFFALDIFDVFEMHGFREQKKSITFGSTWPSVKLDYLIAVVGRRLTLYYVVLRITPYINGAEALPSLPLAMLTNGRGTNQASLVSHQPMIVSQQGRDSVRSTDTEHPSIKNTVLLLRTRQAEEPRKARR